MGFSDSEEWNMFKTRHSVEFLSKYTTIDASFWYNRGKSVTAVAGCSKKMNSYFVQCQLYIKEGEYTVKLGDIEKSKKRLSCTK